MSPTRENRNPLLELVERVLLSASFYRDTILYVVIVVAIVLFFYSKGY